MTAITSPELKAFRAANQSDLTTNGGRMSATVMASGVVGALFPNVDESERTLGSTKYRKMFFKVDHAGPEALLSTRIYQDKNTVGDDKVCFFVGTQTNTQSSITGSERKYGCGTLDASTHDAQLPSFVTLVAMIVTVKHFYRYYPQYIC